MVFTEATVSFASTLQHLHLPSRSLCVPYPQETAYSAHSAFSLTNVSTFRVNNRKKKLFISVIHRSYMYFKILNKNTRVCTLSFKFYAIFCTILLSRYKMKNICTVHVQYCNKQSTLYEQVDALETERTEVYHTTKKQNLT